MAFTPRAYQQEAIDKAKHFFEEKKKYNAIQILPTGSGKSVVIANIAMQLPGKTIVFQPSKEILAQNYAKFISYGYRAGIYSASANTKRIEKTTFATIGSVIKKKYLFQDIDHIIIDECDLVNSEDGMYRDFIHSIPEQKALGLTATPYRLTTGSDGAMLSFLTRTNPRIFSSILSYVQTSTLFESGHLCKLIYDDKSQIDRGRLVYNSTGTGFTEQSIRDVFGKADMVSKIINEAKDILSKRKNLLIFCESIQDAKRVTLSIPGARLITGDTLPAERDLILKSQQANKIRCVVNVGVLRVGYDYPELEAVLMGFSTMSLRVYYQVIGRGMRIHANKKDCLIVDLGGNYNFFGKIETMEIRTCEKGHYSIWNGNKALTNVTFTKT